MIQGFSWPSITFHVGASINGSATIGTWEYAVAITGRGRFRRRLWPGPAERGLAGRPIPAEDRLYDMNNLLTTTQLPGCHRQQGQPIDS